MWSLPSRGNPINPATLFEGSQDIGTVLHPGAIKYDASTHTYSVSASGENMWFTNDAFYFAWKKASGDVSISADISFLGEGKNPHRKAVLMIRQIARLRLTVCRYRPARQWHDLDSISRDARRTNP